MDPIHGLSGQRTASCALACTPNKKTATVNLKTIFHGSYALTLTILYATNLLSTTCFVKQRFHVSTTPTCKGTYLHPPLSRDADLNRAPQLRHNLPTSSNYLAPGTIIHLCRSIARHSPVPADLHSSIDQAINGDWQRQSSIWTQHHSTFLSVNPPST